MKDIELFAALGIIAVAAIVFRTFGPLSPFTLGRDLMQDWPEARKAFISDGRWIAFSKRFGMPYVLAFLVFPFIWMGLLMRAVPATNLGMWFLFGPALLSGVLGSALWMLRVARWMAGDK